MLFAGGEMKKTWSSHHGDRGRWMMKIEGRIPFVVVWMW